MFRHYLKIVFFYIIYSVPIIIIFKRFNIKNINVFKFKNWHHGFAYFTGLYNEKKIFIKVDTIFHLLNNDVVAYSLCKDIQKDSLVDILFYKLEGKIQFIAYEYIDNAVELDENILIANISYIDEIIKVLYYIADKGIIHRDIKLDNFLITNNKLKIIDFTFSNSHTIEKFKDLDLSKSKNCFILEFLGMGLNPKPFLWDDFFSMVQILKKIKERVNVKDVRTFEKYIEILETNIGNYQYRAYCNSRYYFFLRKLKIKIKNVLNIKHRYREITKN